MADRPRPYAAGGVTMFPAILAQVGLPLLVKAVSSGLDMIDSPIAKTAASALGEVSGAIDSGAISPDAVAEANRHVEKMAELDSGDFRTTVTETNMTIRTEASSGDAYVRRARPTFTYVMAATWAVQMAAVSAAIVRDPDSAATLINALGATTVLWGLPMAVIGVYTHGRSKEKLSGNAQAPDGAGLAGVGGVIGRVLGRK